jgi:hypothetical protein
MPVGDSLSDAEFASFLASCRSESATKQQAFADATRSAPRWFYDMGDQSLTIENVIYDMTPIGTHSPTYHSWLWAWANEDFPQPARVASSRIRELHGTTGFRVFITPGISASTTDADDFAALAVHILEARAFFRYPSDGPTLYLAVHDPRLTAG